MTLTASRSDFEGESSYGLIAKRRQAVGISAARYQVLVQNNGAVVCSRPRARARLWGGLGTDRGNPQWRSRRASFCWFSLSLIEVGDVQADRFRSRVGGCG